MISDKQLAKQCRETEIGPDANELYGLHSASIQHSAILRNMAKTSNVERFEAEGEEWILDHTGIKRKPFKVMHREIKALIADKIVVMHNLCKDFAYLRLTRHDCVRTLDTSLFKMFQRKSLKRKLKDLILEYIDEEIQKTVNHSPVEDARACMRLYKVFAREIGIYPVKIVWNSMFGSKEARFEEPQSDIKNYEEISGPHSDILKVLGNTLGEPGTHISVGY